MGEYPYHFTDEMKCDALKIYTDEGSHAYFSAKLEHEIRECYGLTLKIDSFANEYFESLEDHLNGIPSCRKDLAILSVVIVAESAILSDLFSKMKRIVYEAIRQIIKLHLMDEAFHANYYMQILKHVWVQLQNKDKIVMRKLIKDAVRISCRPRTKVFEFSLTTLGFDTFTINEILSQTFDESYHRIRDKQRFKSFNSKLIMLGLVLV